MKNKFIFAGLILAVLLSGCGKDKDNGWDNNTEATSATTEEVTTTEEEATTEEVTLDMEDYLVDDECKLYSIKPLTGDTDEMVAAAMYDEEHVVLLNLDENKMLTVELLSLRSGKSVEACSVKLDEPDDIYNNDEDVYISDDIYSYDIVSASPLVVNRSSAGELLVFNEDFSACTIMSMTNKRNILSAVCEDNMMYYMNSGDQKIYQYDMSDIAAPSDGEEVNLLYGMPEQGQIESTTIQITYDLGEMVWKPDVNMTNCDLVDVDGDVIYMNVYDIVSDCYFYAAYNVNTASYDEMFTVDEFYDFYDGDFDWGFRYSYESGQEEYSESTQGFEYCNYNQGKKYQVFMPEEDTDNYAWYKFGSLISEDSPYMLFLEVKGDQESYIDDVLLWDYDAGPYSSCSSDIMSAFAMDEEIEYGEASERAHELEEKYGIQIVLGANVKEQLPDYTAEVCEDTELMMSAMDDIEAAFDIFPEGFIDELTAECFISITIYLTGTLTSKDTSVYIGQAGAVTSTTWSYQMIGVDVNEWGIKETIVHELCHVIDNKLGLTGATEELNEDWSQYNPEGFSYYDSYIGYEWDYENTSYDNAYYEENDAEIVYFYDDYSKTFPGEDRARVMEHFTEWENLESCYNSSHIQGKLGVFLEYLYDNFESIRNADSFQWQETYDKLISEGTP